MEIGADQARANLSRLLDLVLEGRHFTITRHGVQVARLLPVGCADPQDAAQAVAEMDRFRRGVTLGGSGLRELIKEGRR